MVVMTCLIARHITWQVKPGLRFADVGTGATRRHTPSPGVPTGPDLGQPDLGAKCRVTRNGEMGAHDHQDSGVSPQVKEAARRLLQRGTETSMQ
jgi:hypothetical protein